MAKKVLFYNWTPLGIKGVGGGVAVYLCNLMQYISEHSDESGIEPIFLSSGYYYDENNLKKAYVNRLENYFGVPSYTIVNSPVIAPLASAINSYREILNDTQLYKLISQFIVDIGGVDVIHFHSLEGLSLNVLRLKDQFQDLRIIHSIHDYGTVCVNVRLWYKNSENCLSITNKSKCRECKKSKKYGLTIDSICNRLSKLKGREICYSDVKNENCFVRIIHRIIGSIKFYHAYSSNRHAKANIDMLNKYSDAEICVSKRTAEVMTAYGLDKTKITVDYIGTKVAENSLGRCRTNPHSTVFTILYMGYANKEKGFFCFMNAIEKLATEGKGIVVKIASKLPEAQQSHLDELKANYKDIIVYNGYSHNDFPEIMENVNLGVVPPLWEDNFPQVAIEMVANGIPVLASNRGGVSELNADDRFVFYNDMQLSEKILYIYQHRESLTDYWKTTLSLNSMRQHVGNLLGIYEP